MLAKAKLASLITFIELASFTIVTYDRQNMFIIQATGSDASMWAITLELPINILEASFTLIYDINSTGITDDDRQFMVVICL